MTTTLPDSNTPPRSKVHPATPKKLRNGYTPLDCCLHAKLPHAVTLFSFDMYSTSASLFALCTFCTLLSSSAHHSKSDSCPGCVTVKGDDLSCTVYLNCSFSLSLKKFWKLRKQLLDKYLIRLILNVFQNQPTKKPKSKVVRCIHS